MLFQVECLFGSCLFLSTYIFLSKMDPTIENFYWAKKCEMEKKETKAEI